jgi:hypothetical protein
MAFLEIPTKSQVVTEFMSLNWVTTNSITDVVVKKQRNIYKAFKFVSVVKNL